MALFWEFFTFELKFRFKSLSTYMYFLLWLMFSFFCVASESFGPIGSGNGKVVLNSAYANTLDNLFAGLFGVIVIAAIFGTSILRDFQRDTYQILFTQPISKFAYLGGRWALLPCHRRLRVLGHDARHLSWHFRALGRSHSDRAQSSMGLPSAILLCPCRADLLHRLRLLRGLCPHSKNICRLSAGRGLVHDLPHWPHRLLCDSIARTFLVWHFRSHWLYLVQRHHPLLDGSRRQHAVRHLVAFPRQWRLPLQPSSVVWGWCSIVSFGLDPVSDVGGGPDGPFAGPSRRQSERAGTRRGCARAFRGYRASDPYPTSLYRGHHLRPVPLALALATA